MSKSISALLALLFCTAPLLASGTLHFGPAHQLRGDFLRPYGIAIDHANQRLLVADSGHHRFKWTSLDALPVVAFSEAGYVSDAQALAALADPQAIAADAQGNVYVVDALNGRVVLYRMSGGQYAAGVPFGSISGT